MITPHNPSSGQQIILSIPEQSEKTRLDSFLTAQLQRRYSRTFIQRLIETGYVRVNERTWTKASTPLTGPGQVSVIIPDPAPVLSCRSEQIAHLPIRILFQHPHFSIIEKPPFLSVHKPAHTSPETTLVDWLGHHIPAATAVGAPGRPGIIHRLDKDTSGLMIITTDPRAHVIFGELFQQRAIIKRYAAVVVGHPPAEGTITYNIARHPIQRTRMTHSTNSGKRALTRYRVAHYLDNAALVELFPTTGRTHQLRVHGAAIGHPIAGDAVYGKSSSLINRHALHATMLSFMYEQQPYTFESTLPADMQELVTQLTVNR